MNSAIAAIGAAALGLIAGTLLEYVKGLLGARYQRQAKAADYQLETLAELQVACVELFTLAQDALEERRRMGDLEMNASAALYAAHMRVELLRERVDADEVRTVADVWSDRAYALGATLHLEGADAEWDAIHQAFTTVNKRIGEAIREARKV